MLVISGVVGRFGIHLQFKAYLHQSFRILVFIHTGAKNLSIIFTLIRLTLKNMNSKVLNAGQIVFTTFLVGATIAGTLCHYGKNDCFYFV